MSKKKKKKSGNKTTKPVKQEKHPVEIVKEIIKPEAEKPTYKEKKEQVESQERHASALLIWSIVAGVIGIVIILFSGFAAFGYERLYANRIFPGVRILGVRLDGLTENEARITLNEKIDGALKDGLRFSYKGREITLGATTVAQNDPDASRDLIRYELEGSIKAAMSYGRSGSIIPDTLRRWKSRIKPSEMDVPITIEKEGIEEGIKHAIEDTLVEPKDAKLVLSYSPQTNQIQATVEESQSGHTLKMEIAFAKLEDQAERLSFSPIPIEETEMHPSITKEEIEPLVEEAKTWVDDAPFTLTYETESYEIAKEEFAAWVQIQKPTGIPEVTIDQETFAKRIREITNIEKESKKGSLTIEDDKIISFEAGATGYTIQDQETLSTIITGLGTTTTFPLIVKKEEATLGGNDPERLGIQEIIGIGRSNFAGSPSNRRKNIAIGASRVNGSLIAPGEIFSLLDTLGPITAEHGWLPELVIKGSKTVPELGGGLCQIGTTTFRGALNSGLKIVERRNHSYRVSYYEPAGTDATIYDPAPDFRFQNDTKNYVFIHAYIEGDEVIYEFWGTNDGRKVDVGAPRIYNITSPPPKKLIETTDLEPGKIRCTESAHAGADADLDYRVEYADGTIHEETFHSHYRPWQAVCLVGVEQLSDTASSTSSGQ